MKTFKFFILGFISLFYLTNSILAQDSHLPTSDFTWLNQLTESTEPIDLSTAPFREDIFCWRETYGRGVGTIPTVCPTGMENQAGLCYKLCNDGFYGVGPVCWKSCPDGYRDDGAFCAKPEAYGRGVGFPWKVGDPLNDSKMFERCEAEFGKGNCEKNGLIVYPKCKTNFHNVGCCVCSPDCPSGWNDIGVSCTKPSYGRGVGIPPTGCTSGKENNAGLCYVSCRDNYQGVGPVCWDVTCPNVDGLQWGDCGMGCAKNTASCINSIIDMTVSPLVAVLSIAGLVVSGGGTSAVTATAASAKATASTAKAIKFTTKAVKGVATFTKQVVKNDLIAKAKEQLNGKPMSDSQMKGIDDYAALAVEAGRTYDFDWRDFAAFDPTGLANVAAAYANPLCKNVEDNSGNTVAGSTPQVALRGGNTPVSSTPATTTGFVKIQNNWYKDNYINNQTGSISQGKIEPGWWSAQWTIVPVDGDWVRIQNRWKTDQYIHNQNGSIEVGPMQPNWWSAQWKIIPAHSGWVRIQNKWKPNEYLHNQNGKLEVGPIQQNWASALWKVE